MEKTERKAGKIVVVDANVTISSLIAREGITQAVLSLLLSQRNIKVVIPLSVKKEILRHVHVISRKSGIRVQAVRRILDILFSRMDEIEEEKHVSEDITFYKNLVRDESDTPLVIVAHAHRPCFILTYNKSDFKKEKLEKLDIYVVKPKEILEHLGMEVMVKSRLKTKRGRFSLRSILTVFKRSK